MHNTYFLILFFSVIFPFIFSFHPKLNFYKYFPAFFKANIIASSIFIVWDIYFTKLGIWGFSPKYTTGILFFNLPIEEVLFFVCIPFACLFTIHCFLSFFKFTWGNKAESFFILILSLFLLILGLYHSEKAYTSSTFISAALFLLFLKFIAKVSWIGHFFSIFPIILIPFFIVNGILTGTGLENPIVWYNNDENLSIRLLTIPVEDVFYGIELLTLNYFLFFWFNKKN